MSNKKRGESLQAIEEILAAPSSDQGYDVLIISVDHPSFQQPWKKKLEEGRGRLFKQSAEVIVVVEDWKGGAGNWLGTLYCYLQASKGLGCDLLKRQKQGASIALYHTAGQGKRLYPLTGSEMGNKCALHLPGNLTTLEASIFQTAPLGTKRQGRLSVFWGDQVFIPSKKITPSNSHLDLLVSMRQPPDQKTWDEQKLHHYGLIVNNMQLEKLNFDDLPSAHSFGVSLGSFSLSLDLTEAVLEEFAPELEKKKGRMDSDPHFIMPATCDRDLYFSLRKDITREHYERIQALKQGFKELFFSVIDVGEKCLFWDFGSTANYYRNLLKLTDQNEEGQALRLFFQTGGVNEQGSIIQMSNIASSSLQNCVILNTQAKHLACSECVITNCRLEDAHGKGALLYRVEEKLAIDIREGFVRADIKGRAFTTNLDGDGKKDWQIPLPGNPCSYKESLGEHTR